MDMKENTQTIPELMLKAYFIDSIVIMKNRETSDVQTLIKQ